MNFFVSHVARRRRRRILLLRERAQDFRGFLVSFLQTGVGILRVDVIFVGKRERTILLNDELLTWFKLHLVSFPSRVPRFCRRAAFFHFLQFLGSLHASGERVHGLCVVVLVVGFRRLLRRRIFKARAFLCLLVRGNTRRRRR